MDDEALADLERDIKAKGQIDPIVVFEEKVLDGRHRWLACEHLGIVPVTQEYTGDDPFGLVMSKNAKRRDLTTGQRAALAFGLANMPVGRPNNSPKTANISQGEAAAILNVGVSAVKDIAGLVKIDPGIVEEIKRGVVTIPQAKRKTRKKSVKKKLKDIAKAHVANPTGEYDCLVNAPGEDLPVLIPGIIVAEWNSPEVEHLFRVRRIPDSLAYLKRMSLPRCSCGYRH